MLFRPARQNTQPAGQLTRGIIGWSEIWSGVRFSDGIRPKAGADETILSLRHLVVSRMVSGETCSEQGSDTKMTLAPIFGAWRDQVLNPLTARQELLTSIQL